MQGMISLPMFNSNIRDGKIGDEQGQEETEVGRVGDGNLIKKIKILMRS